MADFNAITGQMRAALSLSDPDLDTSVGTTTRKILDAVAESIAEGMLDQYMLSYNYDIDSKTDGDLDSFCQTVGGIARLAAKRGVGTVTFSRSSTATTAYIPVGTTVTTTDSTPVVFQTVVGGVLSVGQSTVTIPVQAVEAGPTGNVPAGSLTVLTNPIEGIVSVTNLAVMTGGLNQETDDALRIRWKQTVFRSLAGTESMYQGVALNDPDVSDATVIGASKQRIEQVQITAGTATSSVQDAAAVYPTNVFLGPHIAAGAVLIKDLHYTWNNGVNPPTITIASGLTTYPTGTFNPDGSAVMAPIEGAVLELQYEYVPTSSRNNYTSGILNRVDVWCAGQRPVQAAQSVVFRQTKRFSATSTDPLYTGNFVRPDGTNPVANSVFIPLAFGPILAVPDVLTVGGVVYGRIGGTASATNPNAYSVIHDNTAFGYTASSRFGLEWLVATLPADNTSFSLGASGGYLVNDIPRTVQSQVDRWRLVGVDAQTHAAKQTLLRVNLAVMYDQGASLTAVNGDITAAVSNLFGKTGMGSVVQVSDVLQTVHNVAGVDNVRMLAPSDYPSWTYGARDTFATGLQRIVGTSVAQTYVTSGARLQDVVFADNAYPALSNVYVSVRAQNTFMG